MPKPRPKLDGRRRVKENPVKPKNRKPKTPKVSKSSSRSPQSRSPAKRINTKSPSPSKPFLQRKNKSLKTGNPILDFDVTEELL